MEMKYIQMIIHIILNNLYLKVWFQASKDSCRDDAPDTTSINTKNGYQVTISWGLDLR